MMRYNCILDDIGNNSSSESNIIDNPCDSFNKFLSRLEVEKDSKRDEF